MTPVQVTLALPEPLMMSVAMFFLLIWVGQMVYLGFCMVEWVFPGLSWKEELRRNEEIGRKWSQAVWKETH